VAQPRHCASASLGFVGTFIGGSTSEYHYPYSSEAADLRGDYRYCAVRHLELGAGLEYFWASNWHAFFPQLLVRGYLGPATREYEFGLHARGGAALIALPYGSVIGGQAVELVRPLAHDDLLVGPSLSGGIDFRYWIDRHFGFELSLDLGIAWTSPKQPEDDHDLIAASASAGGVMGW
jgi:hypothetical protein